MSVHKPCEFSFELAPYILGELDVEEASLMQRHIEGCDICVEDLQELCEAVAFIEDSSLSGTISEVSPRLGLTRTDAAIEPLPNLHKASPIHRSGLSRLVTAIVAAAAVVVGFIGGSLYSHPNSKSVVLLRDTKNVGYSTLTLQHMSWGTEMTFTLHKLPTVPEIGAWVKLASGSKTTLCWWPLNADQRSGVFVTSTPLSYAEIKAVGIMTRSSRALWWYPVKDL
jgi:hypothetical protein